MQFNFFSKLLRKQQTQSEYRLWLFLRAKRFEGLKFRRQQTIGKYIVDFVCFEKGIVIEIDGSQHLEKSAQIKDQKRDSWLKSQGLTVLRFSNSDILNNIEGMLDEINQHC